MAKLKVDFGSSTSARGWLAMISSAVILFSFWSYDFVSSQQNRCVVLRKEHLAVSVLPEDIGEGFAKPVYLRLTLGVCLALGRVVGQVRQGDVQRFVTQHLKHSLGT